MSTHTPGVWIATKGEYRGWTIGEASGDSRAIAEIPFAAHWSVHAERYEADARLIAAAPELLEALKAFVNDIVPNSPKDPLWEQARAAIQKAESTP